MFFLCVIFELYTRIRPKYGRKKQPSQALLRPSPAVLWNCNYFFTDPVPVPVPAPYLGHKKLIFQKKCWKYFAFFHSELFY